MPSKPAALASTAALAKPSTISSTSAVLSERGVSCDCQLPAESWTPQLGTTARVEALGSTDSRKRDDSIGSADGPMICWPPMNDEWPMRPQCHSCATTAQFFAWSALVTLAHALACSRVYMPGVSA